MSAQSFPWPVAFAESVKGRPSAGTVEKASGGCCLRAGSWQASSKSSGKLLAGISLSGCCVGGGLRCFQNFGRNQLSRCHGNGNLDGRARRATVMVADTSTPHTCWRQTLWIGAPLISLPLVPPESPAQIPSLARSDELICLHGQQQGCCRVAVSIGWICNHS